MWSKMTLKQTIYRTIFGKLDVTKSYQAIENNQLKYSDYSLSVSMHTDDDEQHFN